MDPGIGLQGLQSHAPDEGVELVSGQLIHELARFLGDFPSAFAELHCFQDL
jgi:hypothetical protein